MQKIVAYPGIRVWVNPVGESRSFNPFPSRFGKKKQGRRGIFEVGLSPPPPPLPPAPKHSCHLKGEGGERIEETFPIRRRMVTHAQGEGIHFFLDQRKAQAVGNHSVRYQFTQYTVHSV